jgi:hypothetical protein
MSCRNICVEYKAKKKSYHSSYYKEGLRRCTECEVFIRPNNASNSNNRCTECEVFIRPNNASNSNNRSNTRCPCCGTTLRMNTHDAKVRRKLSKTRKFIV